MACKRTCESEEIHCVLLDDNGFVIISDYLQETGYFFGKIRSDIMSQLVEEGIYKVTKMYDYQGLCPKKQDTSSPAAKYPSVSDFCYVCTLPISVLLIFSNFNFTIYTLVIFHTMSLSYVHHSLTLLFAQVAPLIYLTK